MAQRKHKRTLHPSLREEGAWFTARPMREPVHHSEWKIMLGNMPKNARLIERNPDEEVGCTVTALEYVAQLQDRKKNLAATPVKEKPSPEVDTIRGRMGGITRDGRGVQVASW